MRQQSLSKGEGQETWGNAGIQLGSLSPLFSTKAAIFYLLQRGVRRKDSFLRTQKEGVGMCVCVCVCHYSNVFSFPSKAVWYKQGREVTKKLISCTITTCKTLFCQIISWGGVMGIEPKAGHRGSAVPSACSNSTANSIFIFCKNDRNVGGCAAYTSQC